MHSIQRQALRGRYSAVRRTKIYFNLGRQHSEMHARIDEYFAHAIFRRMQVTLHLHTRQQKQIDNVHDTDVPTPGELLEAHDLKGKYIAATHRPTAVSYTYNCHGLTFGSRRTQIIDPAEIRRILTEDGYQKIDRANILAGDIVVYVGPDGDIEHSGVVMDVDKSMLIPIPKVLSKWGVAHEVVHRLADCPYASTNVEFYRVTT